MLYADVNAAIKTTRDPGGLIGLMLCLVVASFFRALAALIEQVAAGKLLPAPVRAPRVIRPRSTPRILAAPEPPPVADFPQLPPPVDDAASRALSRAFAYLMATEPSASNPNRNSVTPGLDPGISRPPLVCVAINPDANQTSEQNRVLAGLAPGIRVPPSRRLSHGAASPAGHQHCLTIRPPLSKRLSLPMPLCA